MAVRTGFLVRSIGAGLLLASAFGLSPRLAFSADSQLVIGAIGDSITAGFDAERWGDNREMSWATGTDAGVNSHASRLAAATGKQVTAFNEAVAGSQVTDLDRQVDRLLTHNPDYVTLDIGANDVCAWTDDYQASLANFKTTLTAEFNRIVQANPNVRIVVSAIPDMYHLWQLGKDQSTCQAGWSSVNLCSELLGANATDAQRQAFVGRWQAANDALTAVSATFPGNVLHNPAGATVQFTWDNVSHLDCFHPSTSGQALLSEVAWQMVERYPLP